jgi:uncharacterized protein (DUF1800 family)
MHLTQREIQHLFLRAGFGISYEALQNYKDKSAEAIVDEIFNNAGSPRFLMLAEKEDFSPLTMTNLETQEAFTDRTRKMLIELNSAWLKNMAASEGDIREKMTLFWHGHLASTSNNADMIQQQNNLIRKHALGNFGVLLREVSKDAVMLQYLNNQQNRENAPNENFAREVMELFTLGRGHYTEQDIKDAARAFTGWGFDEEGRFVFRTMIHDYGEKTVLGQTGPFEGDDILDILLQQKQTAKFIVQKIYAFFVNDELDPYKIDPLAEKFYKSGYDITVLLKDIFTSEWFYDKKNIGCKIKSPVELIASNMHMFKLDFENSEALVEIQKLLGQILFIPPNVAGWPSGAGWIDASTLMLRLRLMEATLASARLNQFLLSDIDDGSEMMNRLRSLKAKLDWQSFRNQFENVPYDKIEDTLIVYLLQIPISREKYQLLIVDNHSPVDERIFSIIAKVSKLPEFQMC